MDYNAYFIPSFGLLPFPPADSPAFTHCLRACTLPPFRRLSFRKKAFTVVHGMHRYSGTPFLRPEKASVNPPV